MFFKSAKNRVWKQQIRIPVMLFVGVFSLAVTLGLFLLQSRNIQYRIEKKWERDASEISLRVRQSLDEIINYLNTTRRFFECSSEVSWDEYQRFVAPKVHENSGVKAICWISRVRGEQRREYEMNMRKTGFELF